MAGCSFFSSEDELEPSESSSELPLLLLSSFFGATFLDLDFLAGGSESLESEELLELLAGAAFFLAADELLFLRAGLASLSESLLLDESEELSAFFFGATFFLPADELLIFLLGGAASEELDEESLSLSEDDSTFF